MSDARVSALFVKKVRRETPEVVSTLVITREGVLGDYHASAGSRRQLLLQSLGILREFDLEPGALNENVVVDGMDVMALETGRRLRLGSAVLEIGDECEPCGQVDRVRPGLRRAIDGRRGRLAFVISPGEVRVGDAVELVESEPVLRNEPA